MEDPSCITYLFEGKMPYVSVVNGNTLEGLPSIVGQVACDGDKASSMFGNDIGDVEDRILNGIEVSTDTLEGGTYFLSDFGKDYIECLTGLIGDDDERVGNELSAFSGLQGKGN